MKSTLILPSEFCTSSSTVKRALLTYEKVYLKNPDDRDIIPGNDLMSIAAGTTMGMSMGTAGPAKPLGKSPNYDDEFDKLLSEFKGALDEGSLAIMDKPAGLYTPGVGMGYRISDLHIAVYWNYRNMAADSNYIKAASQGLDKSLLPKSSSFDQLAPVGGDDGINHSDERLNNKLKYLGPEASAEELKVLSRMVHARLASISRNLTICDSKGLVPFTTEPGYSSVIQQMQASFGQVLGVVSEVGEPLDDYHLVRKVENIIFKDFLDADKIENLSLKQIQRFRSSRWGRYSDAKSNLEKQLVEFALETSNVAEFNQKVKNEFDNFLSKQSDYIHERTNLGIKILCDVGAAVTGSTMGPSVIQSFIGASSLQVLMALACPASFILAQKRIPEVRNILKKENDLRKLPGYDLYNYYKPLLK